MQYIELIIYATVPEQMGFKSIVYRDATILLRGHPRAVIPLTNAVQAAAMMLGAQVREKPEVAPESTSQPTEGVEEEVDGIPS